VEAATLPGVVTGVEAPALPGMTEVEETAADLWATGLSASRHPTEFVRADLAARGVVTADALRTLPDRSIVEVGGVVTHRQQPETASGVIFLNLEDETGLVNVICTPDVWKRYRRVARTAPALEIRGLLEKYQGVVNVLARRVVALPLGLSDLLRSRDFH
jgi:error-prone DNA polymerase